MANPEDIEFKLKTTGDTSGAEEVKKSLEWANDEAQEAQRQSDVAVAKQRQANEAQKAQAAILREIADGQQRIVAGQLAEAIGKIAEEFKGMGAEADLALTGTQTFLTTLAATGNPIAASLAVAGVAINALMDAYRAATELDKKLKKEQEVSIKKIAELRADYARQIREENLTSFFQAELDALDEQEAALTRIAKIRASERELDAAQAAGSLAGSLASGATTAEGADAVRLSQEVASEIAAINDELSTAASLQANAQEMASAAALKASALQENSDAQIQALDEATKLQAEADRMLADLEADREVATNKIAAIVARGETTAAEIGQAGLDALTQAATTQRDALQAEVDRLGANASAGAKSTLQILEQILLDGQVRADELGRFNEALGRMNGMQETQAAAVEDALNESAAALAAQTGVIKSLFTVFQDLKNQNNELKAQLGTIQ
jgi:hypothetical protein